MLDFPAEVTPAVPPDLARPAPIWPVYGHDPLHGHRSDLVGPAAPQLRWVFATGASTIASTPVVGSDGTIYIGSDDQRVYAIDGTLGTQKWSFQTGSEVRASPAVDGDAVYVRSTDQNVYALEAATGRLLWKTRTGSVIRRFWAGSSPTVSPGGTLYVGSEDGSLYALNARSGEVLWAFPTRLEILSAPALGPGGEIAFTSDDGNLYLLRPDGTKLWERPIDGRAPAASPAIGADGTIYVGHFAFASDGRQLWAVPDTLRGATSATLGADGTIIVSLANDSGMAALDAGTGAIRWRAAVWHTGGYPPAIGGDGTVYVGTGGFLVFAVDSAGKEKWHMMVREDQSGSPAIGLGGTLIFGSTTGTVYALGQ